MVEGAAFYLLLPRRRGPRPRRRAQAGRGVLPVQRRRGLAQVRELGRPEHPAPRRDELRQDRRRGRPHRRGRSRPRPARRRTRRLRRPRRMHPVRADLFASSGASTPASSPWARTSTCRGGARSPAPASSWRPTRACATARRWPSGAAPARGGRRRRAATPSPCSRCSGATSCGPCSSATPGSPSCGSCPRLRCSPSAKCSSPSSPVTATGRGPSAEPGRGTPAV